MAALIIFIENPEKGAVKRRLAEDLGDDAALRVQEALLAHTRSITQDLGEEKFLFYAGYPNWNDAWDISVYRKRVQQGDGAGGRIAAAFEAALEEGHDRIVLIGDSCYALDAAMIADALELLRTHGAVAGAANNGSCYLLGIRAAEDSPLVAALGQTDGSYRQVLAAIHACGIACRILEPLPVIDTMEDLRSTSLNYD